MPRGNPLAAAAVGAAQPMAMVAAAGEGVAVHHMKSRHNAPGPFFWGGSRLFKFSIKFYQ